MSTLAQVAAAVSDAKAAAYADGLRDGCTILLDHLEGRGDGVNYDGPIPLALRDYLAQVRERVLA